MAERRFEMITGRCECGDVSFEISGPIEDYSHCHCGQCRRLHGAAFASFAGVGRSDFRYLSGEAMLKTYASSDKNDRVFCGRCGSNILCDSKPEPESLYIAMGTLDGNPDCPPGYHQYVDWKAPWYEIEDKLPQYGLDLEDQEEDQ
jgi:hypothetical protein